MTKNSLKIYSNNFLLVWKQMLFLLLFTIVIALLVSALALPVVDLLKNAGWFDSLRDFFEMVYTRPGEFAEALTKVVTNLWLLLKLNASLVWGSYLGIIVLIFFITSFGIKISYYTISELLNGKMQSLIQHRYTSKLVSTLKRSTLYALVSMLIELPFFVLTIAVGYTYGILANNWFSATLLLPILSIFLIFLTGLKNAMFACFLPKMINSDDKVFACVGYGLKSSKKHFASLLSSSLLLTIIMMGGTVLVSLFTLGAGLLIVLPSLSVIKCSFGMVSYMTMNKERYYVNESTIVTPL